MQTTPSSSGFIRIKGARQHNLRNLDITIPKNRLVVITGPSGSGKSSLAFDTLFAEGQRRYVESLSAYARQFLDRLQKPDIDFIDGLSPAIAIGQHVAPPHARSTIATTTEIYDYLRLLFSCVGVAHDPASGEVIERQSLQQIADAILKFPAGTRIMLLSPLVRAEEESYEEVFDRVRREGFVRVRIDGIVMGIDEADSFSKNLYSHSTETANKSVAPMLVSSSISYTLPDCAPSFPCSSSVSATLNTGSENKVHQLEVVVDRFLIGEGIGQRLHDSIGTALQWGKNRILNLAQEPGSELWKERYFSTDFCNPKTGFTMPPLTPKSFSFNSPLGACPVCHGLGLDHKEPNPCPACGGKRFRPEILAVTLVESTGAQKREWNIHDFCQLTISGAKKVLEQLQLSTSEAFLVEEVLLEVKKRLQFLEEVGLGYLTLHRESGTLSGGEMQRIRLATQVGSALSGVLYVLDEPSIGLHPRDHARLLKTLYHLRDLGNSVIVVEHDEETMLAADHLIEMGPGAGVLGGQIMAEGTPKEIIANPNSLTGRYLSGAVTLAAGAKRHPAPSSSPLNQGWITIVGAHENNLKNLTVGFPVGLLTCVTGVSGSGKSTLVNKILYPAMMRQLHRSHIPIGKHTALLGIEHVDKVIVIDQSPIGKTPRSNPATYVEIFGPIRDIFANLPAAKVRGYSAGYFSCNVKGGRCEHCRGEGMRRVEMHFLADVFVPCDVCEGRRFQREALEVTFKGRSIADVLEMSVEEALSFFSAIPVIRGKLARLHEVGLGYLKLGQSATTLSGGEAQRLKLASELGKRETGKTLYLLDEPTTGLHASDIQKLLDVLFQLRDRGNTVIVIEHHSGVVKSADWVIDLGPEGGDAGGGLVIAGNPEDVAACSQSITGKFLANTLSVSIHNNG
ncbi:MAG: excinuclease ABC subunit UvrA [Chthoniobacterales bacterium]